MDRTSVMPDLGQLPPDLIMPRYERPERFEPPVPRRAAAAGRGGRRGGGRWTLTVAVVVVVGLVLGGVTWALDDALYLRLPDVAGQSQAAAAQALRADGLSVSVHGQFSPSVPAGTAIGTEPGSGRRVRKDSSVLLDVSQGPDRPPVPDVTGEPLNRAEQAITASGLAVGTVTRKPSSVPEGEVVGTDPTAGTKEQPDTVVDLVVSTGVPPAALPNVVGEPVAQAVADLQAAGFTAQVDPSYAASAVQAGSVVSQSPDGSSAAAGSTVTLTVSSGPPQVTVPDVGGDTEAQARAALTAAGFKVRAHSFLPFGTSTVTSQNPSAGSQADQGSTVTITLF